MSASIATVGAVTTFTGAAGEQAIAQSQVTTSAPTQPVTFKFKVTRRVLRMRVGTLSGGEDIVQTSNFAPGDHVVTFTPGVSPYFVQFVLEGVGTATLEGFARLAPGLLELPSPWTAAQIPSLRHAQSLNTMWFCGGGEDIHVLERRGASSWSIRPFLQLDGPFTPINLGSTTLTPSAQTGTVTITASKPLFATYDEGSLIRLTHSGQFVTVDAAAIDDVTDPVEVVGVGATRQIFYSVSGTFVGTLLLERSIGNTVNYQTVLTVTGAAATYYQDTLDNQVAYYRWRMSAYTSGAATVSLSYPGGVTDGIAKIITVTADNTVTADVLTPFGSVIATSLWSLSEWSGRSGYPGAVALFDGRLWFARGNQYWGSASDNFGSFAIGPLASDAIGRSFGGRMSATRWLCGAGGLLAGLSGFESEIGSNAYGDVLKPENVRAFNKTTKGSADANPALVDQAAMFINRSRQRIYRFGYSNSATDLERGSVLDLTRLHREIASTTGFVEMDWQSEPEPRLWCVRGDGEVGVLVFDADEGVAAWCRIVMDGKVESVCCLPTDSAEDEVYFVVRRVVGGVDVRHVEKLAPEAWSTVSQAWRLHDALAYFGVSITPGVEIVSRSGDTIVTRNGSNVVLRSVASVNISINGTTTFNGLWHLEGRTDVYAWANGQMAGPLTVTGGAVTIPFEVTYAVVGLLYEGRYKSGRLAWGAQMGASLVANKQLESLGLVLHQTAGGAIKWGPDFADMEELPDRLQDGTLVFDGPVQVVSDDIEGNVHGWTERDTRLHITMPTAGPATVLALVHELKVNG